MENAEASGGTVVVNLLDASHRQTLQQWQFQSDSVITIGRAPDREIVIPDARISRLHVVLQNRDNQWWLMSVGQNGVQIDGQRVEECVLTQGQTFRLGQQGPVLQFFESCAPGGQMGNTALEVRLDGSDQIQLDRDQLKEDVREIVEGDFFQELMTKVNSLRKKKL